MDEMEKITRVRINKGDDGIILDMDLVMVYGYNLVEAIKKAQKMIQVELEHFAALNILGMYITAKGLVMEKSEP